MITVQTMVALLVLAAPVSVAQTSPGPPAFEVASVKPSGSRFSGPCFDRPGTLSCPTTELRRILVYAYELEAYQLVCSFPIDRDRYEITAKFPIGSSKEQIKLMLQNLLAERFGLAVHRETRNLPIYELTVAKGGSKLRDPAKPHDGQPAVDTRGRPATVLDKDGLPVLPPGIPGMRNVAGHPNGGPVIIRISARMQPLEALLRMVGAELGRPVVDKTGLTGTYDFTLTWGPARVLINGQLVNQGLKAQPEAVDLADEPGAPDLRAAFARQLGLNLEQKTGPVEVLVVDHLSEKPTEN
jgi:uncharacterized protein (TIGR03435 family)